MQEYRVVGGDGAALFGQAVVAGGFVFVSGVNGLEGSAPALTIAEPDIAAETRTVLERLRVALEAAGSSVAQVVNVQVQLRRPSDFEAMNAVYRTVFADAPPARTTVVTRMPPNVFVTMSAMAVPNGAERETLHPAGWAKSPRPYSYIVRANGFVFLAGLVSRRGSDDAVVPGPLPVQIRTILENAGTLLRTAGLSLSDVVSSRVYMTDESFYETMNAEYAKFFPSEPPARAVAVTDLMGSDASIEISLIASTSGKTVLGAAVAPSLPLSTAVRAGRFTFLSGVLGSSDKATDVTMQTREAMTRIDRTLEAAGLTHADIVDTTVYLPDTWQQPQVAKVLREPISGAPTAGSVVGARLAARAGLVELVVTAWR